MMKQFLIFFLFLSTNVFSQEKNDSTTIVQLLVNDYKTLGNWDIQSHIENCTTNYLLIENGEVWDMKKESEYFIKNAGRVIDRKDYFDIKYIRIYGNYAYAVYNLKSDITENGNLTVKTWIESTIFRKIKGKWKVELINSTPVSLNK
jgi:hypothetical protein